jgi:hypothetical protein
MSDYEKQANDFAKKHGIKLEVLDQNYKQYFTDDKECRWVFELRLTRKRKQYTFEFGQSIAAGGEVPSMYSVLACLTKYDPEDFEDFCDNFGYDIDSRKAEKTYHAVVKEWKAVERLFGDILEELQEIN